MCETVDRQASQGEPRQPLPLFTLQATRLLARIVSGEA